MYRSVLSCNAHGHAFVCTSVPGTAGWWSWGDVLAFLIEFERDGVPQKQLSVDVQRCGAAGALAVALAVAQLGLLRDDVRCYGWPGPPSEGWSDDKFDGRNGVASRW